MMERSLCACTRANGPASTPSLWVRVDRLLRAGRSDAAARDAHMLQYDRSNANSHRSSSWSCAASRYKATPACMHARSELLQAPCRTSSSAMSSTLHAKPPRLLSTHCSGNLWPCARTPHWPRSPSYSPAQSCALLSLAAQYLTAAGSNTEHAMCSADRLASCTAQVVLHAICQAQNGCSRCPSNTAADSRRVTASRG